MVTRIKINGIKIGLHGAWRHSSKGGAGQPNINRNIAYFKDESIPTKNFPLTAESKFAAVVLAFAA